MDFAEDLLKAEIDNRSSIKFSLTGGHVDYFKKLLESNKRLYHECLY
jgi:hypothetical protein